MDEKMKLGCILGFVAGFNIFIGTYEKLGKLNALNVACAGVVLVIASTVS